MKFRDTELGITITYYRSEEDSWDFSAAPSEMTFSGDGNRIRVLIPENEFGLPFQVELKKLTAVFGDSKRLRQLFLYACFAKWYDNFTPSGKGFQEMLERNHMSPQRVVVNRGTDSEVYGTIFSETPEEITLLLHMGSLRKIPRRGNKIEILP